MSTLDSYRTVHPPLQASAARSAPAAATDALQAALEDAAITIPQLLRQRAAIPGSAAAVARRRNRLHEHVGLRLFDLLPV